MVKAFLYVTEDMYDGLHGIEDFIVEDFDNENLVNEYALEMGDRLITSFALDQEYDEESYDSREHINWNVWPIKKEYCNMSNHELDKLACNLGADIFRKEYCEVDAIW